MKFSVRRPRDERRSQHVLRTTRRSAEWDAALELIHRHQLQAERAALLWDALDDLLEAAQIATIEAWAAEQSGDSRDDAIFDLARGEVCLRQGSHASARVLAERALRSIPIGDRLQFRALKLAGQAEHVSGREDLALELFRKAELAANTLGEQRDARWAQLMSSVAFELDESPTLIHELTRTVQPDSPADLMRLSGRRICFDLISERSTHLIMPVLRSSYFPTWPTRSCAVPFSTLMRSRWH